jgi:predicted homoserine dehydrogenase-like protein
VGFRDRLEGLQRRGTPIRVGLVGVGQMGRGLIAQVRGIPGMEVVAAADLDLERTLGTFQAGGQDPVEGADGRPGRPAVTQDPMDVVRSASVEVVVEATGIVEVGARVAYEAILEGKHVVMLNVETDVTVGAALNRMARSAGVVYTGSAGDEPGAILELYDFARSLGFEVLVAGKGKNNPLDPLADAGSVDKEAREKGMNPKMLASFVDGTKTMVEMGAVANATGLSPDMAGMHGPEETVPDRLADVFGLRENGGVLSRYGVVDYVRGVAPGVFVIVRSQEGPVRETFEYLGQGKGPNHVLYRPYHLTSLETPISVARAAIYGEPTIACGRSPTSEVVAVAKRDLTAGDVLGSIGSADYYGWLYEASEARDMLPLGLASGARITRNVTRGQAVPRSGVELAQDSFVASLRRLQETSRGGDR